MSLLTWCPKQCTCVRPFWGRSPAFRFSEHLGPTRPEHRAPLPAAGDTWLFSFHLLSPFPFPSFLFSAMALVGFLVPQLGIEPGPSAAVRVHKSQPLGCRQCPRLFSRGPLSGSTVETPLSPGSKPPTLRSQMPRLIWDVSHTHLLTAPRSVSPAQPWIATCYWPSPRSCAQPRLQGQQLPNEVNHPLLPSHPTPQGGLMTSTLPKPRLTIPLSHVQPVTPALSAPSP